MLFANRAIGQRTLAAIIDGLPVTVPNQQYIPSTTPGGAIYEIFHTTDHFGRDSRRGNVCNYFGQTWVKEPRSAIQILPSILARLDSNILINPAHPKAAGIAHGLPAPIWRDERLYALAIIDVSSLPHSGGSGKADARHRFLGGVDRKIAPLTSPFLTGAQVFCTLRFYRLKGSIVGVCDIAG